jgi:putative ABC transport system permease protein
MLSNYLKLAAKVLLRRKFFTAISLFGITFTLLVLVLVAALLDHALGPVGPEQHQDRILVASGDFREGSSDAQKGARRRAGLGYRLQDRFFRDLPGAERSSLFLEPRRVRAYRDGYRITSDLKLTDADYWRILAFTFVEGGPFDHQDVRQASPVVVISEASRQRFFDGAPALGRSLELDGQRWRVVGVVRDVSRLRATPWADIWAPVTTSRTGAHLTDVADDVHAIVLAKGGADLRRMREELAVRVSRWDSPDVRKYGAVSASLRTTFEDRVNGLDRALFGRNSSDSHLAQVSRLGTAAVLASLLFMLLPALNLVNLNVSRILERAAEIGVRKSFGASSRALVAQFVVENVVLTLAGGALAGLLAGLLLARLSATGWFGAMPLTLSVRVFLAGLALALLFGLVSGVYPAWRMARMHPLAALRGAVR